jgi:sec-independent protein translocase protein TatB
MGYPPILLGTLGMTDSLILMVLALVVFGPRRLPQIGRQIGKLMYEFRKASNDFKFQMEEELRNSEEADRRKKEEERQRSLAALAAAEQVSVSADPPPAQASPSPYPDESKYPGQYPPESSDAKTDESVPRILPPAVGETVPRIPRAESPATTAEESSAAANFGVPGQEPAIPQRSSGEKPPEASETAEALNQHG